MAVSKELMELLVCPECKGKLRERTDALFCPACGLAYPVRDGIAVLLPSAARHETSGGAQQGDK